MDVRRHARAFVQDVQLLVMLLIVTTLAIIVVRLLVQEIVTGLVQEGAAVIPGIID